MRHLPGASPHESVAACLVSLQHEPQFWLDQNDPERVARLRAERQATIRSPVPGRDPEYVRLVAPRKRLARS